ncbi:hypothetical protein CFOL_v3_20901, partial [Cephalotus follicularis]
GRYTEWTDEKHSLYLGFLEASFIKQLHRFKGLRSRHSQESVWGPFISGEWPAGTHNPSDEYMVQRGGCWQKINFERDEPLLVSTADSHVLLESPWIQHFRSGSKRCHKKSTDLQEISALRSEGVHFGGNPTFSFESGRGSEQDLECHLCHQNSVGSSTEVSDQNFVDGCDDREKSSVEKSENNCSGLKQ